MKIVRRVLWSLYAWPITLLLLGSDILAVREHAGIGVAAFLVVDFLISCPSILAMHLHIWDKRLFNPFFWKVYTFVFYAWDLSLNLVIEPAITGEKFEPESLIAPVILLPFYVAVFRYAFRRWDGNDMAA